MPSQNLQDAFLNSARKERLPVTIYLTSGVKLSGRVRGFDKYCVVFEANHQEQLIFKHAISTVVIPRQSPHGHGAPGGAYVSGGSRYSGGDQEHEPAPGVPRQPGEPPRPGRPVEDDE
jgi:host factor-I protein